MSIITIEQYATARADIAPAYDKEEAKIQRCIDEAEQVDLYDVLGDLYFEVVANKANPDWADLMNGSTFTYLGKNQIHIGLIKYIAGKAYSRYLPMSQSTHTSHGYVTKLNQNSEPVNYNAIRDERKDVDTTLEVQFKMIENYIRTKPDLFGSYDSENNPNINTNKIKTTTLR